MLKNKKYDYVILGGGCAGLSLAYHLNLSKKLSNKTLCIVEKRKSYSRDKTWSFWNFENHLFNDCVVKSWNDFYLKCDNKKVRVNCSKYPYQSINSNLFYEKILSSLKINPNIFFTEYSDKIDLKSGIVFNSIPKKNKKSIFYQHFYGVEIEIENDYFEPKQFCLMDFSHPKHGVHFFYILPYSSKKALIETTWISKNKSHKKNEYLNEIETYLNNKLNIYKYNVCYEEIGSLPLSHFNHKKNSNEILIGSAANLTRKSTGYTFSNIQSHSKFITKNIADILSFPEFKLHKKYSFYDDILFKVIENYPSKMPEIFTSLFSKNTSSALKFLSNKSNLVNDFKVIKNLPKRYFLKALLI
ncbi:MAG: lycopene cyclase [Candidatus Marinimicrobia bacterium]|nr:lycopene cyclase [Candidatus Neomarinimicrobiota bacterium]